MDFITVTEEYPELTQSESLAPQPLWMSAVSSELSRLLPAVTALCATLHLQPT